MTMTYPNRSLRVRCLPQLMTAIAASGTERAPAADLVLHNGHVSAPDFARFATLGVVASVQPPHAVEDRAGRKRVSVPIVSRVRMPGARYVAPAPNLYSRRICPAPTGACYTDYTRRSRVRIPAVHRQAVGIQRSA